MEGEGEGSGLRGGGWDALVESADRVRFNVFDEGAVRDAALASAVVVVAHQQVHFRSTEVGNQCSNLAVGHSNNPNSFKAMQTPAGWRTMKGREGNAMQTPAGWRTMKSPPMTSRAPPRASLALSAAFHADITGH